MKNIALSILWLTLFVSTAQAYKRKGMYRRSGYSPAIFLIASAAGVTALTACNRVATLYANYTYEHRAEKIKKYKPLLSKNIPYSSTFLKCYKNMFSLTEPAFTAYYSHHTSTALKCTTALHAYSYSQARFLFENHNPVGALPFLVFAYAAFPVGYFLEKSGLLWGACTLGLGLLLSSVLKRRPSPLKWSGRSRLGR